jgi:hypothetical protein
MVPLKDVFGQKTEKKRAEQPFGIGAIHGEIGWIVDRFAPHQQSDGL